ncbi:MAG: TIGR01777 family oxidoreductase [Planctomycetaceae bacterium]
MNKHNQKIAVSGATGLVGSDLIKSLKLAGHSTLKLSRRNEGAGSILWDPAKGVTPPEALEGIDVVVHLAGENIAGSRWTAAVKERIRSSRVDGTRNLVKSLALLKSPPKTLVCASAIGFYGHRGEERLNESSVVGSGYLADVCKAWEAEALEAEKFGIRVVRLRIGVVLSNKGGALAKMLLPFKLGVGGTIGSGKQFWSWIGLNDLVRIICFCVQNEGVSGAVNAVSPHPMTNYDFTKAVGTVLHRPTIFPMPAFAAKLALGEMADDLLLSSIRVEPDKLRSLGFQFAQPDLISCLKHELS